VCVHVCVCVYVREGERERARTHVEDRAKETERGWGKVGERGGERDRVYFQACKRESLCVCVCVREWK